MWGRGSEYAHAVLSFAVRRVDSTRDGAIGGGTNCCVLSMGAVMAGSLRGLLIGLRKSLPVFHSVFEI